MTTGDIMQQHIHLASDHAGFALKSALALRLSSLGHHVEDHGAHSAESCDYPLFARKACEALLEKGGAAILICGTGIGMSMAANRIAGIRAALCSCEFQAKAARRHNNANALCLGERVIGAGLAFAIVDAFLENVFEGGRHQRRIELFDAVPSV